jgi:hypothetical protein
MTLRRMKTIDTVIKRCADNPILAADDIRHELLGGD